ncbi:DUF2141 domain-containing protein [Spirosoma sp. SC4-14]|uniref:DUF2141 domain-containing protein n=1 Tax=Spirosoma sp. SC4-14 TaxID=3128900 RepID=UPI0030D1E3A6
MNKLWLISLLVSLVQIDKSPVPTEHYRLRWIDTGEVTVDVSSIKGTAGKVVVCVFKTLEGFPNEVERATQIQSSAISGNSVKVTFRNLEPGDYYISAFHDTNNNGKPDRNFVGIPKEGVGASNNVVKNARLKPDFGRAKIHIHPGSQQISFDLRYF